MRKEVIWMSNKYVTLERCKIKTEFGTVHLEPEDTFTYEAQDIEEHVKAGRAKPLTDALAEEYNKFKRILDEFEMVKDEIQLKNPSFANIIQNTINQVETYYVKEEYKKLKQAVKNLKALYLQAIRGQY
jgi:hypothetical protein